MTKSKRNWWSVHIEVAALSAKARIDPADERLRRLAEILAANDGVVSSSPTRLSLRCSVSNERHDGALGEGTEIVQKAIGEAGLPIWPVVRAEAVCQDLLEAELEEPATPEVLGVAEVAKLLGVTRQRLAVIRRDHESFPKPFVELAATPLWYREAVEEWAKTWARRPGPSPSALAVAGLGALLLSPAEDDPSEAVARGVLIAGCMIAGVVGAAWLLRQLDMVAWRRPRMAPRRTTARDKPNWQNWAKRLAAAAVVHFVVDLVSEPRCPRCKQRTWLEWCQVCRSFVWPRRHWPRQEN